MSLYTYKSVSIEPGDILQSSPWRKEVWTDLNSITDVDSARLAFFHVYNGGYVDYRIIRPSTGTVVYI